MRSRHLLAFFLAGSLGAVATEAPAVTFLRHPWLSLQTSTSILIAWQTDLPASSTVLYGAEPLVDWCGSTQVSTPGEVMDHEVALEGLAPETAYRYAVVSDTDTLDAGTFRTAPEDDTPFRFLAFGDVGKGTPAQRVIAERVDSLNADFAVLTGDIIYDNGEPWNFTPYYFDIYRPTLKRIPFYPALGNHDTYYDGGASYVDIFHLPTNFPSAPERCYSFDYGNAHFAAIDVTIENNSPDPLMTAWLAADLAASNKKWKFVFFHVPAYSNEGSHGGDAIIAAGLDPILTSGHVDMVFQGHNHFYTRTYPIAQGERIAEAQDPHYLMPGAPIYIVTGGGGRSLHPLVPNGNLEVISQSVYHTTVIDVEGDLLTLRAVLGDGTVFDTMTLRKGTPTAVAPATKDAPALIVRRTHPNPSRGPTEIAFTLARASAASLRWVDVRGRTVKTIDLGLLPAGAHRVTWDGHDDRGVAVASGRYFAVLRSGSDEARVPLTLLR